MTKNTCIGIRTQWRLFTLGLIFIIGLFLVGCGEAISIEGIDTGGGGSESLMLSWTPPTTNEDGTPLEDLARYRLYYGSRSRIYSQNVRVGSYTSAVLNGLNPGTYYLAVTAYDIYGNESDYSDEINHTIF